MPFARLPTAAPLTLSISAPCSSRLQAKQQQQPPLPCQEETPRELQAPEHLQTRKRRTAEVTHLVDSKFNVACYSGHWGGGNLPSAELENGVGVATACCSFRDGCAGHCQPTDVWFSFQQEIKKKEDGKIAKKHQYEIKVTQS